MILKEMCVTILPNVIPDTVLFCKIFGLEYLMNEEELLSVNSVFLIGEDVIRVGCSTKLVAERFSFYRGFWKKF